MARASSPTLLQRLRAYRWRRVGVLAAVSLALSLLLVGYLFGWESGFFSRLLTSFLVSFCLLAVTFLAAIPFIAWASRQWFGAGWVAAPDLPAARRRPVAGARPPAGPRQPAATPLSSAR